MKLKKNTVPLSTIGLAVAVMLSACGGGGSSVGPVTLSGAVIDGYIKGATVCLDVNANGVCDTTEPSAVTDVNGKYSLTVPTGVSTSGLHLIAVVPVGAEDSDTPGTPVANAYKMLAPADMPAVVSPLTTMVSTEMIANGKSVADARIASRTNLALPVDYDFMKDHVASATSDTKAHNVAKVMAAILAVKVGTGTPNASSLGQALAQIKSGTTAVDAYNSSDVSGVVSGILGTPAPAPSAATIVTFDETSTPTLGDFGQGATLSVTAGPTGGSGKAAKMVKGTGQPSWNGMFWTLPIAITPTSTTATITARVWADTAGTGNRLYIEDSGGGQVVITSTSPSTLVTGQWQTVTWNFTGMDMSKTYTKMGFVPNFGGTNPTPTPETYYFDSVTFLSGAAPTPTPTPTPSATTIVTFDETSTPTLGDFGQGATLSVAVGPTGGSGKAAKMVKGAGQPSWNGMFWTLPTAITPTSTTATFTGQVWADTAGTGNRLYIEDSGGGQVVITSTSPSTLVTGQWQTVTWNFVGIDMSKTYTKMGFVPNFGGTNPTPAPETYYFDSVTYLPGAAPTPTPSPSGVFSTGFKSNFTTVEGGGYYPKSGGSMDGWNCTAPGTTTQCGSGGVYTDGANPVSAANSGFYSYYQIPLSNNSTGEYVGVGVYAPGITALSGTADTAGISIAGKTNLNFRLEQNPEWYGIAGGNDFMISMDMGKVYPGGCHVQLRAIVTPTALSASYAVPLSSFAVVQDCGTSISLANVQATQSVAQISFEGDAGGASVGVGSKFGTANTTVANGNWYPTTVRINGGINFN